MYSIEEKVLTNNSLTKKIPIISFHNPEMAIVAEFLMTDAPMLQFSVLEKIDQVLSGKKEKIHSSGQRTSWVLKKDVTKIEDLFDGLYEGVKTHPPVKIETKLLKDLIYMWQ